LPALATCADSVVLTVFMGFLAPARNGPVS
jgi:hypothetical protein